MSVREAQEKVSSYEFAEWVAYHSIQPFGESQAEEHNAWHNYWAYVSMNGAKDVQPQDFMLTRSEKEAQTIDEKMALLQAISTKE